MSDDDSNGSRMSTVDTVPFDIGASVLPGR